MVEAAVAGLGTAFFGGVAGGEEILGGVDQRDMGEGLRVVASEAAGVSVVFLGEETERGAEREEAIEESDGFVAAAEKGEAVDEPEGARKEGTLAGREAVDVGGSGGMIAADEAVGDEIALDGFDRADDAWIVDGEEADEREHEEARVELLGAVELREDAVGGVVTAGADLVVNAIAGVAPAVEFAVELELLEGLDAPIEGDPGHHFRVREVAAGTANFPDAFVGFLPVLRDEVDEVALDVPGVVGGGEAEVTFEVGGVDDLAVDVELELARGGVADADGAGVFVSAKM